MITSKDLKKSIASIDVVYQPINSLIDVANNEHHNMRNVISSEVTNNNWKILSRKEAISDGFKELAEWSTKDDYLIEIELHTPINDEFYILVCLPKKSFSTLKE